MFQKILIRNLIFMMLPIFVMILVIEGVHYELLKLPAFQTYDMATVTDAERMHIMGRTNIELSPVAWKSAGFSYEEDDESVGEYGYIRVENQLYLVALKNSEIEKLENNPEKKINFKIVKDSATSSYVSSVYAKELKQDEDSMKDFVSPYILDQMQFPTLRILAMKIMLYAGLVILTLFFVYTVLCMLFPLVNVQTKCLDKYRHKAKAFAEIDQELSDNILFDEMGIIITEHYCMIVRISRIEVERRSDLQEWVVSTFEEKGIFGKFHRVYRLASIGRSGSFHLDFEREEDRKAAAAALGIGK